MTGSRLDPFGPMSAEERPRQLGHLGRDVASGAALHLVDELLDVLAGIPEPPAPLVLSEVEAFAG